LREAFINREYGSDLAKEYANHGVRRRLSILAHCIEQIFRLLPPEIEASPSASGNRTIPPPGGEGRAAKPRREGGQSCDVSITCPPPSIAARSVPPRQGEGRRRPHTATIFPGFMILSGSNARFTQRIASSASGPSSFSRYFILPCPTPCSPVQVPSISSARCTRRST
jgi:hypothetical protein